MIKNIIGNNGINVMSGNSYYTYINMGNPSAGMVRYNGNNQNFEVYDGNSWLTFSGNSTMIELDSDTQNIISWARTKRAEEEYLKSEAEKNPAIKDLLNQRNEIDNKITMVKTLLHNCQVCEQ